MTDLAIIACSEFLAVAPGTVLARRINGAWRDDKGRALDTFDSASWRAFAIGDISDRDCWTGAAVLAADSAALLAERNAHRAARRAETARYWAARRNA